jgi:hypothetical protein
MAKSNECAKEFDQRSVNGIKRWNSELDHHPSQRYNIAERKWKQVMIECETETEMAWKKRVRKLNKKKWQNRPVGGEYQEVEHVKFHCGGVVVGSNGLYAAECILVADSQNPPCSATHNFCGGFLSFVRIRVEGKSKFLIPISKRKYRRGN